MPQEINVYCDESCHLERDGQCSMVLGAVWCPLDKAADIAKQIRGIKALHNINPSAEVKWTKVSPAKAKFYLGLVNYFFAEDDLHFRALIVPDKGLLKHDQFPGQDHDKWYYKMYFDMLKILLSDEDCYNIYIDVKDTRGGAKVQELKSILANSIYDFDAEIVKKVQLVRSHEIQQMQLADLLIGCVSFVNRGLDKEGSSPAKRAIVHRVRQWSGFDLTKTTLPRQQKMNLFKWHAKEDF